MTSYSARFQIIYPGQVYRIPVSDLIPSDDRELSLSSGLPVTQPALGPGTRSHRVRRQARPGTAPSGPTPRRPAQTARASTRTLKFMIMITEHLSVTVFLHSGSGWPGQAQTDGYLTVTCLSPRA